MILIIVWASTLSNNYQKRSDDIAEFFNKNAIKYNITNKGFVYDL